MKWVHTISFYLSFKMLSYKSAKNFNFWKKKIKGWLRTELLVQTYSSDYYYFFFLSFASFVAVGKCKSFWKYFSVLNKGSCVSGLGNAGAVSLYGILTLWIYHRKKQGFGIELIVLETYLLSHQNSVWSKRNFLRLKYVIVFSYLYVQPNFRNKGMHKC